MEKQETYLARFIRRLFSFLMIIAVWTWLAPRGWRVISGVLLICILGGLCFKTGRKDKVHLAKTCFLKRVQGEFKQRLRQISPQILLPLVLREIYPHEKALETRYQDGLLMGKLAGEKIALVYLPVYGAEAITTRGVLPAIYRCFQEGIIRVWLLTNGEFAFPPHELLAQLPLRIKVEFYNGEKLQHLLRHSLLVPTIAEIKYLIATEKKAVKHKKIVCPEEIWQTRRLVPYLGYACFLFLLALFRWGFVFLNVILGLFLFVLAVGTIVKNWGIAE